MDTQTLKTFVTLAQIKNFTQTAEHLFVAQSTVTNRIAELEKEIGKKLFERSNRQIELTSEGIVFLSYANRILELTQASIQEINTVSKYRQTLRIGTTNTIYESYLSEQIQEIRNKQPEVAIKVTLGHSAELLQQLQDGVQDIVYTYIPLNKKGYSCEIFHQEKLKLVTDYQNQEYQEGITRDQLITVDYLMCNFMLQEIGEFIRELFPPYYQFSFEIDNSTKLVPYLIGGKGYSFLPEQVVEPYLKKKQLREIKLRDFEAPVIKSLKIVKSEEVRVKSGKDSEKLRAFKR